MTTKTTSRGRQFLAPNTAGLRAVLLSVAVAAALFAQRSAPVYTTLGDLGGILAADAGGVLYGAAFEARPCVCLPSVTR
jgi:hypothetical protein